MELSVALDSYRRRDLQFFDGDTSSIVVTVYAKDGDVLPVAATGLSLQWGGNGSVIDTGLSGFSSGFHRYAPYTLTGTVNGARTTLAYGLINRAWDPGIYVCCNGFDDRIFDRLSPPELTFLTTEAGDSLTTEAGDLLYLS